MKIQITFPNESTTYGIPIDVMKKWVFEITDTFGSTHFCITDCGQVFSIEEEEYIKL